MAVDTKKLKQIGLIILVIYLAGTLFYLHHFYPNTTINGIKVSNCSVGGMNRLLERKADQYLLIVEGKDGTTDDLTGEELGLHVEWEKIPIQQLLFRQIGFDWPVQIFCPHKLTVDYQLIRCNQDKVAAAIEGLSCMDPEGKIASTDAAVVKNDQTGTFEIQEETTGTIVDSDRFLNIVIEKADSLEKVLNLEETDCYQKPAITVEGSNIYDTLEQANTALQTQIIYNFGNEQYEVLDSSIFYDWIYVDSNLNFCVDADSVIQYVDQIADTYDDYTSGKWFNTYNGNRVYIPVRTYGWRIDRTQEVSDIISEISEGARIERYPDYSRTANNHNYSCWGDTYIEVDITLQHMWCYKDGVLLLSTDVVTGCPENDTGTDTGIYAIEAMISGDVQMVGEDYVSTVQYFMRFNYGEGFHDASWRDTFGGDIYLTSGSHGCVNMPPEKAEELYDIISVGYPVIVYTDDMTEGPSE